MSFFNRKNLMMTKIIYLYDNLCFVKLKKNTKQKKIVKISITFRFSDFFKPNLLNSRFFKEFKHFSNPIYFEYK